MLRPLKFSNIKKRLIDHADLLILLFIGVLICQTWFKPDYIIAGGDYFPFIFPSDSLQKSFFAWDHYEVGLGSSQYNIAHAVVLGIFSFFSMLGFPISLIQRFYFTALFILPAFSMYFLVRAALKNSNWTARVAASFFYMINVFVMTYFWSLAGVLAYILIPLLLAILIKAFRSVSENKNVVIYAVLFSIVSIGTSYLSLNPAVLIIVPIIMVSYSVFHLIFCCANNSERKGIVKFLLLSAALSVLVNLWWIAPFHTAVFETKTVSIIAETNIAAWSWTMARNQLTNVFRLNTLWAFTTEYYHYAPLYSTNPLLIAATFVPSLLVAAALLFRELRKNKFLIYSFLILVPLFFIVKGIQPPFGWIYEWIYLNVPYFWLFREPASKFFYILIPIYAVIIGFSVSKLCSNLSNIISSKVKNTRITGLAYSPLVVAIIFFSIASYPLFTGEIVAGERGDLPSMHLQIPDYWYEAANYVNDKQEDFRLLMLPKDEFYQLGYDWGYYGTDTPPRYFFEKPTIVYITTGGYLTNRRSVQFVEEIYSGLYNDTDFPLADALAIANVKYVVERNDVDWTRFGSTDLGSPEKISSLMENKEGIRLEESIGKLDLYVNEKNAEVVTVHSSAEYVEGTLSDLFYLRATASSSPPLFLLEGTNNGRESDVLQEISVTNYAPKIVVARGDPTHYDVLVQNATGPYWLSFADSYDDGWVLFCKGKKIEEHFVGNGYANAWKIEEKGDYILSIDYEPQQKAKMAYAVSIIAFTIYIIALVILLFLHPKIFRKR